jgi:hypothetical protein
MLDGQTPHLSSFHDQTEPKFHESVEAKRSSARFPTGGDSIEGYIHPEP